MSRTRATKITRIKFLSIKQDIRHAQERHSYKSADIAKMHHVSVGTIQAVARCKTWPAFVTAKQLRATMAEQRKADEYAKDAGFYKGVLIPAAKRAAEAQEKQLAIDLDKLAAAPTRDEFDTAIRFLHERMDAQLKLIQAKQDKAPRRSIFKARV
ncbi:hypothetical protein E3O44_12550 [Cryobacterium algoricola]|uniref:Uncharacterized protein n=1 Tax=Cryobacterium algoricola TaxID=1259183 RepID=A0ABY2IAF3_9MICO|nr:hypothetical protein [Cryobacterium algoricola]TFB85825.1 hypothetical protein E3O44_12550 [Cryobacterium algoricola]